MIDEKLSIAVEQSNKIIDQLNNENKTETGLISTKRILNIVQYNTNTKIGIDYISFSNALKSDKSLNYGAMMCVYKENNQQIADIVINNDISAECQRFSLVHELGHLMTGKYNIEEKGNRYKISAHINQDVFSIPKEEYDKYEFLLNEQIANVFALRILIPYGQLRKKINECGNLDIIAKHFGVEKDAIISRLALGE